MLSAVADKNYSSVHSYFSFRNGARSPSFERGMNCVRVRLWKLCKVYLILCSLELLQLKSGTEIHERVKIKKKKKRRMEGAYLFCRSKHLKRLWLLYCKVVYGMTPPLCLVCVA